MTIAKTVTRLKKVAERDLAQLHERLAFARAQAHAGDARHGINGLLRALENAVMACPDKLSGAIKTLAPIVEQAVEHEEGGRKKGDPTPLTVIRVGNALNAIEIAGADLSPASRAAVLDWFRHTQTKPRDSQPVWYWTTVFGALALDTKIPSPKSRSKIEPGTTFESDLEGLATYLRDAISTKASLEDVRAAWEDLVDYADALHDAELADSATVLWIARIVYHRIGGVPLGDVAQRFHDDLWKLAGTK